MNRADSPLAPRLGVWAAIALLVFVVAALLLYADLWRAGPRSSVLASAILEEPPVEGRQGAWRHTTYADTAFATWLVSRNADALLTRPWRLMETEHCAPMRRSIALGEPMLTMGVLAAPVSLLVGDPVLSYNAAVLLVTIAAALAMFLLVADWTGAPVAGVVAGLLFAFHPGQITDVTHRFAYDMAWTLFALFFAQRLFAFGRWRDAFGLAASIVLQMGASLYPLATATFLAPPLALWLALRRGGRRLRWSQIGVIAGVVGLAVLAVYGPYLELRDASDLLRRDVQRYVSWVTFAPGGRNFPGWPALALALAALALGRQRALSGMNGDPRVALVIAGVLVALAAAGGNHNEVAVAKLTGEPPPIALPNLYAALSAVIPGLDAVRSVANLAMGVQLVVCILAGLGAAGLLRVATPRHAVWLAALMLMTAGVDALRPGWLGFAPRVHFEPLTLRPADETIAFFERLSEAGNDGPLIEIPMVRRAGAAAVGPILLSAWHGRRTSACFGSFRPPELAEIEGIAARLPDRDAAAALREHGFTTLIVHEIGRQPLAPRFLEAARSRDSGLRHLQSSERLSAFALEP